MNTITTIFKRKQNPKQNQVHFLIVSDTFSFAKLIADEMAAYLSGQINLYTIRITTNDREKKNDPHFNYYDELTHLDDDLIFKTADNIKYTHDTLELQTLSHQGINLIIPCFSVQEALYSESVLLETSPNSIVKKIYVSNKKKLNKELNHYFDYQYFFKKTSFVKSFVLNTILLYFDISLSDVKKNKFSAKAQLIQDKEEQILKQNDNHFKEEVRQIC